MRKIPSKHGEEIPVRYVGPVCARYRAWLDEPHLAQGQGFEVVSPERWGVLPVKPVVGTQVGGVDVPRVARPEVVG